MIVRLTILGILLTSLAAANAETVLLKDKASITGKVLAEKRDVLVVDVGFTVISIPKSAISKVAADEEPVIPKAKTGKGNGNGSGSNGAQPAASRPAPGLARPDPSLVSDTVRSPSDIFKTSKGILPDRSVRDLVSQLGEAVVQVRTPGGLGSGFFINEEGHLITNFHVIEGETQISIEVYHQKNGQLDRRVYKQVRILAMNKFQDLALLKIDEKDLPKFAHVPLGDADQLSVGERVFAIGSPLGLERTVTEGIVSTKTRQFQGELYIQTTAQINPGNSGGPLFNLRGEVTGVTNMKVFGEGIGFAIPVENVKYFLKHRDAYAYDTDNPSNPYRYLEPPSRLKQVAGDDSSSVTSK
jgi:serine protease Do